jgi:hypothetical protein
MSNSGTGYLLGSFRFNSPSGSGTKTTMGGVVWVPFRHGTIKPSSLVPIMVDWHKYFLLYIDTVL